MSAWDLYVDAIDHFVVEDDLELDLARQSKHVDLKLVENVNFEGWPLHWDLSGLGHGFAVDYEAAVGQGFFDPLLSPGYVFRQVVVAGSLDQVEQDVLAFFTFVDFQVVGCAPMSLLAFLDNR